MFRDALKILRVLLGAFALMGIIGGGFGVRAETAEAEGGEAAWGAGKSAKPAMVGAARAAASCLLGTAAKTMAARVLAPVPAEMIFAWVAKTRSGAAAHGARLEPEREPSRRARPGVVRLLI